MSKPILCVDFDGVIHSYASGWQGAAVIADPPTPGALRWLWKATEWWDVQVYSSRSRDRAAREAMLAWMILHARAEFGIDHPLAWPKDRDLGWDYPITFAHEKPSAFLTIDDRAICFEGDWSELDPADLLHFKPWNKRPTGATGAFPMPALNDHDQGELRFGVAYDPVNGVVRIDFGKPVAWFAMPREQASQLGLTLLRHAGAKNVEITF